MTDVLTTDERVEPTVSEQRAVLNNPACAVETIKRQQAEIERRYKDLAKANAQHEHFEREWYLRGDEIERLERALTETHDAWTAETTKRLQAVHERDCAVEDVARLALWRPIETAPRDVDALFRVVSLTVDDPHFVDTTGNPIISKGEPTIMLTRYGRWSSLSKATHWMPLPAHPDVGGGA